MGSFGNLQGAASRAVELFFEGCLGNSVSETMQKIWFSCDGLGYEILFLRDALSFSITFFIAL
jgi:hypothetical protein